MLMCKKFCTVVLHRVSIKMEGKVFVQSQKLMKDDTTKFAFDLIPGNTGPESPIFTLKSNFNYSCKASYSIQNSSGIMYCR